MENYSALVDISWISPTFAPHSVNQLRSLRIVGDGSESTKLCQLKLAYFFIFTLPVILKKSLSHTVVSYTYAKHEHLLDSI